MHRTTIMLPHDLKVQAVRFSEQKGVSLGQLIRECLQQAVQQAKKESGTQDCFFEDKGIYQGEAPDDLCSEHDAYLYGPRDDIH